MPLERIFALDLALKSIHLALNDIHFGFAFITVSTVCTLASPNFPGVPCPSYSPSPPNNDWLTLGLARRRPAQQHRKSTSKGSNKQRSESSREVSKCRREGRSYLEVEWKGRQAREPWLRMPTTSTKRGHCLEPSGCCPRTRHRHRLSSTSSPPHHPGAPHLIPSSPATTPRLHTTRPLATVNPNQNHTDRPLAAAHHPLQFRAPPDPACPPYRARGTARTPSA
ncbi:hypothetical protein C8R45DRAFT_368256 [Mycena sanguinolenta]|nr:hypothetical protein C8R45DRAFT_368256 [Mycena sanguinolenta]